MLIIEDKNDVLVSESSLSKKILYRPRLIERLFYKLYNACLEFSSTHPQFLLFCMFLEHLQVSALLFCDLVLF